MRMKSSFAQPFRPISLTRWVARVLALCVGALFLAGCGLVVRHGANADADARDGGSYSHVHIYA